MTTALDSVDPASADPSGMIDAVVGLPDQWEEATARARSIVAPVEPGSVSAVVVVGMGGSGIAGDVAAQAAAESGRIPVVAVKGATLPAFVGPGTLVVAASHSGRTAETLAAYAQAGEAGALRLVVTSGGELLDRAHADEVPAVEIPGAGQPRTHLADLAVPVLVALERAGVLPEGAVTRPLGDVPVVLRRCLERWGPDVPTDDNEAKRLATTIGPRVPVFYGTRGWPALAALRAKCQVNENAERPAFRGVVPEVAHNEVVGWGAPRWRERFAVVALRVPDDEEPTAARILDGMLAGLDGASSVTVAGPSPLARFAAAALLVDLVSVYLAYLDGVDPTPVTPIDALKQRLRDGA